LLPICLEIKKQQPLWKAFYTILTYTMKKRKHDLWKIRSDICSAMTIRKKPEWEIQLTKIHDFLLRKQSPKFNNTNLTFWRGQQNSKSCNSPFPSSIQEKKHQSLILRTMCWSSPKVANKNDHLYWGSQQLTPQRLVNAPFSSQGNT
jgi:hypothetical protein